MQLAPRSCECYPLETYKRQGILILQLQRTKSCQAQKSKETFSPRAFRKEYKPANTSDFTLVRHALDFWPKRTAR